MIESNTILSNDIKFLSGALSTGANPYGLGQNILDGNTAYSSLTVIELAFASALNGIYTSFEPALQGSVILTPTLERSLDLVRARIDSSNNTMNIPMMLINRKTMEMKYSSDSNLRKYVGKIATGKKHSQGFFYRPVKMDWVVRFYTSNMALMNRYIENLYVNASLVNAKFEYNVPQITESFEGVWTLHPDNILEIKAVDLEGYRSEGQLYSLDVNAVVHASLVSAPLIVPKISKVNVQIIYED